MIEKKRKTKQRKKGKKCSFHRGLPPLLFFTPFFILHPAKEMHNLKVRGKNLTVFL